MALNVSQIGDNPGQPFISAETYIPDQLIAGNMKLVTDTVTIGGAVVLKRGSVLGQIGQGTIAASSGKAYATNTVLFAAVPTATDTLTIAGTAITFVAANPTGNQVQIGATTAATALNLVNFLDGSVDVNLAKFTYALASSTVTMTAVVIGTGGNALTLATSNGAAFTLGGATASGGTANTGAETIGTISAGPRLRNGNYLVVLTSTTQANVFDPNGVDIGPATVGTQFVSPHLSFLITTGAGIAAGDQFSLTAAPGSGQYVLASAAAVDGSEVPVAVLADDADPTSGVVNGGVYLMGEFNVNAMTFGNGISIPYAKTALRPFGIFLKTAVLASDPS